MTATTTHTFRAAYINDCRLTDPEHAHLPDDKLIAAAVEEMKHAGIYSPGDEASIEIGSWTELGALGEEG